MVFEGFKSVFNNIFVGKFVYVNGCCFGGGNMKDEFVLFKFDNKDFDFYFGDFLFFDIDNFVNVVCWINYEFFWFKV